MKKILVIIFLMMILTASFMTLSSCSPKKDEKAAIQIWRYDYEDAGIYSDAIDSITFKLKTYCMTNNIPVEVMRYGEETLSYEDYLLKRNAAMAKGNMIVLDDARSLHDIALQHADYSKLANYNKLMDQYKDRFCIPIGVGYRATAMNSKVIKHYGINTDKNLINYDEYLQIMQQMKEKGARFKLNFRTFSDTIQYYMIKNGIRYLDEYSDIIKNKEDFKTAIKKTVIEAYEDLKLYNDNSDINNIFEGESDSYYYIYDKASDLTLLDDYEGGHFLGVYSDISKLQDDIMNSTLVLDIGVTFYSPCAYLYKKVTNYKVYDVFNQILEMDYYKLANPRQGRGAFFPVIDTEEIREFMEVDEHWEHKGVLKAIVKEDTGKDIMILNTVNDGYKLLVKDKTEAKNIADAYFSNNEYYYKIRTMIAQLISRLSTGNLDYNKKENDEIIDKVIDDFILNFNIHYK